MTFPLSRAIRRPSARAMQLLVFVCTSNTCRSPMAQQFACDWLRQHGLADRVHVISRGLTDAYEPPGSPASAHGVTVLAQQFSLDLSTHRSALISQQEAQDAFAIIGVTRRHLEGVRQRFPGLQLEGKLHSLARDVPDPWHAPLEVYQACALAMKPLVEQIMTQLFLQEAP